MATQLEVYNEALRLIGEHSIANTSVDEEPRYVLDDAYARVVLYCLTQGWWRFAFFTTAVTPTTSSSYPGYSHAFAKPTNWHRTHSVGIVAGTQFYPIDWYEQSSIAVKFATGVSIKYVKASTTETNPANWPEPFAKYVAAYLAFECCERIAQSRASKGDVAKIADDRLAVARQSESVPPPLLLPEHGIERATRQMLELGMWKFASVTGLLVAGGTPSTGYAYAFAKPAAWMRTLRAFRLLGATTECDIDFRDEVATLSTNVTPAYLRYISTAAITPSAAWPESFRRAWEALLTYESMQFPGAGASANSIGAAYQHWQRLLSEARLKDEMNERPRVNRQGRFNAARRSGSGYFNREQGY